MGRLWVGTLLVSGVALVPACLVQFEDYPTAEPGADASAGSSGVAGASGSAGSGAGSWGDACVPKTCSDLSAECGTESDGCGAILDCGGCTENGVCADNICNCTPTSCAAEGKNCGQLPDGCGGTLDCGECIAGQVCGGAGTPNVCAASDAGSCAPKSCQDQGKECGVISDLCGATLDCGGCVEMNHVCTLTNTCLCLPKTCGAATCGTLDDGCNGTIACGSCTSGKVCNPATNQCCVPIQDAQACGNAAAECGFVSNGCGGSVDCGTCVAPATCDNKNKCS